MQLSHFTFLAIALVGTNFVAASPIEARIPPPFCPNVCIPDKDLTSTVAHPQPTRSSDPFDIDCSCPPGTHSMFLPPRPGSLPPPTSTLAARIPPPFCPNICIPDKFLTSTIDARAVPTGAADPFELDCRCPPGTHSVFVPPRPGSGPLPPSSEAKIETRIPPPFCPNICIPDKHVTETDAPEPTQKPKSTNPFDMDCSCPPGTHSVMGPIRPGSGPVLN